MNEPEEVMADEDRLEQPRGLFDGFEAYRTPTDDEYDHALNAGLVVLDSNVLLNLYRYNVQARSDLFAVLEKLGDRLWIPHQVAVEFWRNRESASDDLIKAGRKAVSDIDGHKTQVMESLRAWANRVSLEKGRIANLEKQLEDAFSTVIKTIGSVAADSVNAATLDTRKDLILTRLEEILRGKVGDPPSDEDRDRLLNEAARRVSNRVPPGYMDGKTKTGDLPSGDYLVWAQTLREAKKRSSDVVLVTGDVKPDWWREEQGKTRGPRIELVEEFRRAVSARLFMMRPETLLVHAGRALRIRVHEASVKDVERVDSSASSLAQEVILRVQRHAEVEKESSSQRFKRFRSIVQQYINFIESRGFTALDTQHAGDYLLETPEGMFFLDTSAIYADTEGVSGGFNWRTIEGFARRVESAREDMTKMGIPSDAGVIVLLPRAPIDIIEKLSATRALAAWQDRDTWKGTDHAVAAGLAVT